MNLPTGIKSEALKPVAVVIGPGTMIMSVYGLVLYEMYPGLGEFLRDNTGFSGFVLFILAVFIGMLVEDIGSRLEVRISNKILSDPARSLEEWYKYLACTSPEPLGFRYISTVVVRLKFELGLLVSSVSIIPGVIAFSYYSHRFNLCEAAFVLILLILLISYCHREAKASIRLLDETRRKLLEELKG